MVSAAHNVCRQGLYLTIISASVESHNPQADEATNQKNAQAEIQPAFDLIGGRDKILDIFITISD